MGQKLVVKGTKPELLEMDRAFWKLADRTHRWCRAAWLHSCQQTGPSVPILHWLLTDQCHLPHNQALAPHHLLHFCFFLCLCLFSRSSPHSPFCLLFPTLSPSPPCLSSFNPPSTLFSICPSPLPCNDFSHALTSLAASCFSISFPPFLHISPRSQFPFF